MHVNVALKVKLVESTMYEFSQPLAPLAIEPRDAEKREPAADTPVLPMGSSTIAPGLSIAVC